MRLRRDHYDERREDLARSIAESWNQIPATAKIGMMKEASDLYWKVARLAALQTVLDDEARRKRKR